MDVTIFTDPGCPFGFNAQRQELQLLWHYGDAAEIHRTMIVLAQTSSSYEERGLSREMFSGNAKRLRSLYGMPMLTEPGERIAATASACRAYVGARMYEPRRADLLLRALRRRAFSDGQLLDELDTIHGAARDANIATGMIDGWLAAEAVGAELNRDMVATRTPTPEALALAHRLSKGEQGLRYSTASAVFERDTRRIVMPGFQPFEVYEVSIANVAPKIERRPPPETAEEILTWAPYPLATAEVAALRGIHVEDARRELELSGAKLAAAAGDGYWSLN
ncbi:MAG: hypothetical protein JOY58_14680 [Solirubrobacterales bacterium]|nr:hypothetical protein [Solirubrobacterales bacterium]